MEIYANVDIRGPLAYSVPRKEETDIPKLTIILKHRCVVSYPFKYPRALRSPIKTHIEYFRSRGLILCCSCYDGEILESISD